MAFEVIADYANRCGENPLWHVREQKLYWVDIPTGRLMAYEPASGRHDVVFQDRPIGGFTVQVDGSLLLFMDRGTVAVWRGGRIVRTLIEEIPEERRTRFNDVIADPAGRVFCGTMPLPKSDTEPGRRGRLYRLDPDGSYRIVVDHIGCSNGMGFTPDRKQMYYTDSTDSVIYLYDYDEATGALSNRRDFANHSGESVKITPDGMTVDAEGRVWSARWGGSCVARYDAQGQVDMTLELPCPKITAVCFGGPELDQMYVTSAGGDNKQADGSHAGALFRVDGHGTRGVAEFDSRIGL